jgi:hypothetical protein
MKRWLIVSLVMMILLLPVLSGCEVCYPSQEYDKVRLENERLALENQELSRQYDWLWRSYEDLQKEYDQFRIEVESYFKMYQNPKAGGWVCGKLERFDIDIGDNRIPIVRDRIYLSFESGIDIVGYGDFDNYNCLKVGCIYRVDYLEIEDPENMGEGKVVLRITAIMRQ